MSCTSSRDPMRNGYMKVTIILNIFIELQIGGKEKNNIISFKNEDETIEGTPNLILHATEFYKNLFGPDIGNLFHLDSDLWEEGELVSEEDNSYLTRPFTEEEIKSALFQMEKKTKLQAQTAFLWSSSKDVGILSKKTYWIYSKNSGVEG